MTRTASDRTLAAGKRQETKPRQTERTICSHGHRWAPRPPLGAILISIGKLTDAQLNLALSKQRRLPSRKPIGELLVEMGVIQDEALNHALSIQQAAYTQDRSSLTPR